jgi:hypothetical protein
MNPWLAYLAVMLAFVVGYMIGHRFGRDSDSQRVLSVMTTTTSGALTPVTMIHTPKRPPAKIRAKRKAKP